MRFSFLRRLFDLLPFRRKPKQLTLSMVEPPEPWPRLPDPAVYCRGCSRRLTSKRSKAAGIGSWCRRMELAKERAMKQESIL